MVWFQCEDCGENLKKPKLPSHFRACSAAKLSCIDCGVVFNRQSVQNHTQCVSEAEKYGPKISQNIKENLKENSKEKKPDDRSLDTIVGLSTRAPWSCSLCNVKATSQETLLLHSQGKKHRSKVKAIAMSTELPSKSEGELACNNAAVITETVPRMLEQTDCNLDSEVGQQHKETSAMLVDQKGHEEAGLNGNSLSQLYDMDGNSAEQEKEITGKKRKLSHESFKPNDLRKTEKRQKTDREDVRRRVNGTSLIKQEKTQRMNMGLLIKGCTSEQGISVMASDEASKGGANVENAGLLTARRSSRKNKNNPVKSSELEGSVVSWEDLKDVSGELMNLQKRNNSAQCSNGYSQPQESSLESWSNLVKWKKIIRKAFKNASSGSLTIKLLRKAVLPHAMKTLEIYGFSPDEKSLQSVLDSKIRAHKKLVIDGKKVMLARDD